MTAELTPAALRAHHARMARMLADPECVGELLLVGVALGRGVDLNDPAPIGAGFKLRDVGLTLYGSTGIVGDLALPMTAGWQERRYPERGWRRILSVLRADIRRYEPAGRGSRSVVCGRPRIRTEGLCGRSASANHIRRLTDPATGERVYVGACSNTACRAWFAGVVARNRREVAENPPPVPPANAGGVLERHLPEIDWWALWRHLDLRWTPPPEGVTFEQPRLRLLLTEDDALEESATTGRPALTALPGGWR